MAAEHRAIAADELAARAEERMIRAEKREAEAEAKQATAELELADNRRRAEGPKLVAVELVAGQDVVLGTYDGISRMPPDGTHMRLMLANRGATVDEVSVEWHDPKGLELFDGETLRADPSCSAFLHYDFNQGSFRMYMRLPIKFTSPSGAKLTHVYEVLHGGCEIRRIDPA